MEFINFKPEGGKLMKIHFKSNDSTIIDFKLRGDFFIHPEESIDSLEKFFIGKILNHNLQEDFDSFLNLNNIQIFGFKSSDLIGFINKLD